MPEAFAEYQTRVLSYLGSRDPIRVQRLTPRALERRLAGVPRSHPDSPARRALPPLQGDLKKL